MNMSICSHHSFIRFIYIPLICTLIVIGCDQPNTDENEDEQGGDQGGVVNTMGGANGEIAGGAAEAGVEDGMGGATGGMTGGVMTDDRCVPSAEGQESALRFLQEKCGLCHGAQPQYGAPYSLIELDSLLDGEPGERHIDRAVTRLIEGTMPPTGQPQPTQEAAQAFVDWATCEQENQAVSPPGGFTVTRPLYSHSDDLPAEVEIIDLLADEVRVDPNTSDEYHCFRFYGPGEIGTERAILRFEPMIDDSRVVHHIVLYETQNTTETIENAAEVDCGAGLEAAIYAWAPGQGALQFKEGGLVSGRDRQYTLEIHYNNEARYEDINDSSGVRIYHSAPQAVRIDMMTLGPDGFYLPPRERTEVVGDCEVKEEVTIVAMMPHMHELGRSLSSKILRAGSTEEVWEDLIELRGWDFNYQLVYDGQGVTLSPGDRVRTSCIYENETSEGVFYGAFTKDEMCYDFVYVTPPVEERRCNESLEEMDTYEPGVCAPEGIAEQVIPTRGEYKEGTPPPPIGGVLPRGYFMLSKLEVWFDQFDLGIATVDPTLSFYNGAGFVYLSEAGEFIFDLQGTAHLTSVQGAEFMRSINLSFGGLFSSSLGVGESAAQGESHLSIELSCPQAGETDLEYSVDEDGKLTFYQTFSDPVPGTQVTTFVPFDPEQSP